MYHNTKDYLISLSAKQKGETLSPKICENYYCETKTSALYNLFHNMFLTKKTHDISMVDWGFKKFLGILIHNHFYFPKFKPQLHRLFLFTPNKVCQSLSCNKNVTVTLDESVTPKNRVLCMLYLKITI